MRGAVGFVKRPFQLHQVPRRLAPFFPVGAAAVQQVNFARPVQQPWTKYAYLARSLGPGMPSELRRSKGRNCRAGTFGARCLRSCRAQSPGRSPTRAFLSSPDLKPAVGFPQQSTRSWRSMRRAMARTSAAWHGAMRILQPLQHGQHRPEPPPSGGDPWHRTDATSSSSPACTSLGGCCPPRRATRGFEKGRGFFRRSGRAASRLGQTLGRPVLRSRLHSPKRGGFWQGVHGATTVVCPCVR